MSTNAPPSVLVGCEFTATVREAFKAKGWDAWSCDLQNSEKPGQHIKGDLRNALNMRKWHRMIAFPDCTYLCGSGMHWTTRGLRDPELTEEALEFVKLLMASDIPQICIENPVGIISTRIRKPDQIIQPYWFGEDASKKTCLWLKGLPKLRQTKFVPPRMVCKCGCVYPYSRPEKSGCPECGCERSLAKPRWGNQTDSGQNKLGPSETRGLDRARTYPGIANAMADQWP